jgi:hypothetical protein
MRSSPVLLLLIAFGVLYLAATGRLAAFVQLLQKYDGDPSTGWSPDDPDRPAVRGTPPFSSDLGFRSDVIGGVNGWGYQLTPNGWMVV